MAPTDRNFSLDNETLILRKDIIAIVQHIH